MKKVYVLLVAILSIATTLNAQDIKIGTKTGLNLASVAGDGIEAKSRTAFHIGGMAEIPINGTFYLQPELLFSSQGYKLNNGNNGRGVLNYISVPIIGKYYVTDALSIEAGPQIGYLLSAKIKVEDNGGNGNVIAPSTDTVAKTRSSKASAASSESDIKEFFKSSDISFGIGAGYKLDNGIYLSARYNLGLSNISEDSEESVRNSVFMLSVGYFLF